MRCEKGTLYEGIRVTVTKFLDAGTVKIARVEIMGEKLIYEVSGGQPYNSAYNLAEQLAITVDAEFVVNNEVIRPSLKGEYWKEDIKKEV